MHGHGELSWPTGEKYKGNFQSDMMYDRDENAKSEITYPDGRKYIG